jgi:hypothetical protein
MLFSWRPQLGSATYAMSWRAFAPPAAEFAPALSAMSPHLHVHDHVKSYVMVAGLINIGVHIMSH